MAQYRTGQVTVTNGTPTVTGVQTSWVGNVSPGDLFIIKGGTVVYEIANVDNDNQITLSGPYQQESKSGTLYAITRDFTPIYSLPYPAKGDIETGSLIKRAMGEIERRIIERNSGLAIVESVTVTAPPSNPTLGKVWIVPTGATGAWAGQTNKLAVASRNSTWKFTLPQQGWRVNIVDEDYGDYIYDAEADEWVATGATNSRNEASEFADDAYLWAYNTVDAEVIDSEGRTGYSALHHATKAGESATEAAASETAAGTYRDEAQTYRQGIEAFADDARAWANNPSDVEVTDSLGNNGFSALHHAADAGEAADLAEIHKNNAETAATDAATSETNAATSASEAETAKTGAETAQAESETARDTSQQHRDEARDWAIAPRDTEVTDSANNTGYSAFHWAKDAEASAAVIDIAEGNVENYKNEVVQARDFAETYRDEAYRWANTNEDQQTSDSAGRSGYSAFHHAQKAGATAVQASDSAAAAATSETNAATSETNAATSETNAATSASEAATSATEADASATEAYDYTQDVIAWSTGPVDTEVTDSLGNTGYSAFHHATKAGESATAADTSAGEAATSASEASVSAGDAETAKTEAISARDAADQFETQAQAWAENPEDTEVASGQFSALHHAAKAEESATASATSATEAATSASEAATSATDAEGFAASVGAINTDIQGYVTDVLGARDEAQAAETKAEAWAETPEDTEVDTGKFSALHHAAKAEGSATAAAASETTADTRATDAETAQTGAETAQTDAETARDTAYLWANEVEDTPVDNGEFSALHHASKAGASATLADTRATDAETARDGAQTAEIGANAAITDAETARDDAQEAEIKAEAWAETPQDTPVEPGKFSALHWAQSVEDTAQTVIAKESDIAAKEAAAEQHAIDAEAARDAAQGARDTTQAAETNVIDLESEARLARDGAEAAEGNADISREAAYNYREDARKWATNDPDDPFVDSSDRAGYSARHWAEQARQAAGTLTNKVLVDEDGDTKIEVEETPDEDVIRMYVAGEEKLVVDENGVNGRNIAQDGADLDQLKTRSIAMAIIFGS